MDAYFKWLSQNALWENGLAQAGRMRSMILGRTSSAGAELDKKLWQITMEEQERGWLEGPFEVDSALDKFGKLFAAHTHGACSAFLVCRKGTFRPIDDYSVCGANSTVGTEEQPFLQTLDALVSQIRFVQRRLVNTRGVEKASVKGRSIDLDNAFRQLATKGWPTPAA
eukprot:4256092-Amphidinium_carterae.1